MKFILKPKPEAKTKYIFLFFPRYCSNCKLGWFWQTVMKKNYYDALCPKCGEQLWLTKQYAQKYMKS